MRNLLMTGARPACALLAFILLSGLGSAAAEQDAHANYRCRNVAIVGGGYVPTTRTAGAASAAVPLYNPTLPGATTRAGTRAIRSAWSRLPSTSAPAGLATLPGRFMSALPTWVRAFTAVAMAEPAGKRCP